MHGTGLQSPAQPQCHGLASAPSPPHWMQPVRVRAASDNTGSASRTGATGRILEHGSMVGVEGDGRSQPECAWNNSFALL